MLQSTLPMKPTRHEAIVQKIRALLESSEEQSPTLTELGKSVGLSPYYLQRIFTQATGISPKQYAAAHKLTKLKASLQSGDDVTTALYEAGYSSPSRLYEDANNSLGMTPATYRRGGAGLVIRYSFGVCSLGTVLLAATSKGVCAVRLGDEENSLLEELKREFFAAQFQKDQEGLAGWLSEVVYLAQGSKARSMLPLDVLSTAFQRRVWEVLRQIPKGETRSYQEIAAQLGDSRAARAVGNACAKNPVALLVPCHRAVRQDDSLGGYRWGLSRKKKLLEEEKKP